MDDDGMVAGMDEAFPGDVEILRSEDGNEVSHYAHFYRVKTESRTRRYFESYC